jgi:signal transduction histidine kinase
MPRNLQALEQRQRSAASNLARHWAGNIALIAAFGLAYFLIARLSLGLYGPINFLAVFWPGFGLSAGVLIALGPRARWPVAAGIIIAILMVHLIDGDPLWLGPTFALCDVVEALVTAGLIERYFGSGFGLERLRHIIGLIAAAVPGAMASFAVWIVASKLFQTSAEPILTTWRHWFIGDIVGFVTLGPFLIGLFAAVRQPPPRGEFIEGTAAVVALALMTGIVILLPQWLWETMMPVAWLFPILFWVAAKSRPVFAAAGACVVSITVVWTTVFGIGHFGYAELSIDQRNLQAQATILVVSLGAFVLAALFAERRKSEARLAHSNMLLERERENKLMNAQAIIAAIAHEIRQPLGAITNNAAAALRWLERAPPDQDEARLAIARIQKNVFRASEVFDSIRTLFGKVNQKRQPVDVNETILSVIHSLEEQLKDHGVTFRHELAAELPLVAGHSEQLRGVIVNLVINALEAMRSTTDRDRVLRVRTELRDRDTIAVAIQDTGPGIDPSKLAGLFGSFVTTKTHGTGLGLAICHMIVEHHDGQLTASSDGKSGTLFQFILPIE